jgi:hypothetical protein
MTERHEQPAARVLIIYRWTSEEHKARVKRLADALEEDGVQVDYDGQPAGRTMNWDDFAPRRITDRSYGVFVVFDQGLLDAIVADADGNPEPEPEPGPNVRWEYQRIRHHFKHFTSDFRNRFAAIRFSESLVENARIPAEFEPQTQFFVSDADVREKRERYQALKRACHEGNRGDPLRAPAPLSPPSESSRSAAISAYFGRLRDKVSMTVVPTGRDSDPRFAGFHDWGVEARVAPVSRLLDEAPLFAGASDRLTAEAMAARIRAGRVERALIVSEAGQGKSSFVRQVLRSLVADTETAAGSLVPVFVPLKDLDWSLITTTGKSRDGGGRAGSIRAAALAHARRHHGLPTVVGSDDESIVWLFDGLDEIPPAAALALCKEFFSATGSELRVIATSRPGIIASLEKQAADLPLERSHRDDTIAGPYRVVSWKEADGEAFVRRFFPAEIAPGNTAIAEALIGKLRDIPRFGGDADDASATLLADPLVTSYACLGNATAAGADAVSVPDSPARFFRELVENLLKRRRSSVTAASADWKLHSDCLAAIATATLFGGSRGRADVRRLPWGDACRAMLAGLRRHAPQRPWTADEARERLLLLSRDASIIHGGLVASSEDPDRTPDHVEFADIRLLDALAALDCAQRSLWRQIRALEAMAARRLFFLEILAEASKHYWWLFAYGYYRWFPRGWVTPLPGIVRMYIEYKTGHLIPRQFGRENTFTGRQGLSSLAALYRARARRVSNHQHRWATTLDKTVIAGVVKWGSEAESYYLYPRSINDESPRWYWNPEAKRCLEAIWQADPILLYEAESLSWWRWNKKRNVSGGRVDHNKDAVCKERSGDNLSAGVRARAWPTGFHISGVRNHDREMDMLWDYFNGPTESHLHRVPDELRDYDGKRWGFRDLVKACLSGDVHGMSVVLNGHRNAVPDSRFDILSACLNEVGPKFLLLLGCFICGLLLSWGFSQRASALPIAGGFGLYVLLTCCLRWNPRAGVGDVGRSGRDDYQERVNRREPSLVATSINVVDSIGFETIACDKQSNHQIRLMLAVLLLVEWFGVWKPAWRLVSRSAREELDEGFLTNAIHWLVFRWQPTNTVNGYASLTVARTVQTSHGLHLAASETCDLSAKLSDTLAERTSSGGLERLWWILLQSARKLGDSEIMQQATDRLCVLTGLPRQDVAARSGREDRSWENLSSPSELDAKDQVKWLAYHALIRGDVARFLEQVKSNNLDVYEWREIFGKAYFSESGTCWDRVHIDELARAGLECLQSNKWRREIVPSLLFLCEKHRGTELPVSVEEFYASCIAADDYWVRRVWPVIVRRLEPLYLLPDSVIGRAYVKQSMSFEPEIRGFVEAALPEVTRTELLNRQRGLHTAGEAVAWLCSGLYVGVFVVWAAFTSMR